ncbi:C-type lectin domain family 12 member B-like [Carassius carassius]|uniref:C-type lectin domain family 12 member B-like n=1 Tax=Carassius carassius TaxID=217509 RepID=UPI0028688BC4|nr:C-type lectin domain family 12 member B-like [Carassius carassius]
MSGHFNEGMDTGSIMDSEDRIEKEVDIYVSAEAVRDMKHKKDKDDFDNKTLKIQTTQHTGSDSVRKRSSRAAVVCLVLLCVLLLTAVIVLCVTLAQERQQFITKNENLTNERKQLILKITNLTNEREQLILKNTNLTNEREQLRSELHFCVNWTCYQSSFYYMSKEKKNWTESRRYCTERGADLIIINNREEKDFIHNMSGNAVFYIGLTDSEAEGRWKWVDNSTLNSSFWASGEPNGGQVGVEEDCVVTVAVPQPGCRNIFGDLLKADTVFLNLDSDPDTRSISRPLLMASVEPNTAQTPALHVPGFSDKLQSYCHERGSGSACPQISGA